VFSLNELEGSQLVFFFLVLDPPKPISSPCIPVCIYTVCVCRVRTLALESLATIGCRGGSSATPTSTKADDVPAGR
jgi:hypothetical protein